MDYSSLTKDELLAEIDNRRALGRTIDGTSATLKNDLIAALELDDAANQPQASDEAVTADPLADLPGEKPDPFADLPATPSDLPANSEYKGAKTFRNINDGEVYALVIKKDAADGKTHFLKNKRHFDNCTTEEFRARYDKE